MIISLSRYPITQCAQTRISSFNSLELCGIHISFPLWYSTSSDIDNPGQGIWFLCASLTFFNLSTMVLVQLGTMERHNLPIFPVRESNFLYPLTHLGSLPAYTFWFSEVCSIKKSNWDKCMAQHLVLGMTWPGDCERNAGCRIQLIDSNGWCACARAEDFTKHNPFVWEQLPQHKPHFCKWSNVPIIPRNFQRGNPTAHKLGSVCLYHTEFQEVV